FLIQKFILNNKEYDTSVCFIQDLANSFYKIKSKNKILWAHALLSEMIKEDISLEKQIPFFLNYNHIIAISNEVKLDLIYNFKGFQNNIKLLYNPLNRDNIIKKAGLLYPIEFKKYENKLKILSIGRLIPSKGFNRLIKLKQKLESENIEAEFFILGQVENKQFYNKLKKEINDSGISIHFLGAKENPYPYIKNADIIVQPSIHEGYGLVVAESLLLNTPVIASNINAYKEFANNEIFYVPNNDDAFSNEAFEAIKKIISGQRKGDLSNTNILDIKEYVNQLKAIL
ncbi:MAG: glycosyltransferase, partial [Solirubrobacteraceae bacterium]